jgi:hypothetical protein
MDDSKTAKACCITSLSSESEAFSIEIVGYKACNNNNRFVSDLEPEILTIDCELLTTDF